MEQTTTMNDIQEYDDGGKRALLAQVERAERAEDMAERYRKALEEISRSEWADCHAIASVALGGIDRPRDAPSEAIAAMREHIQAVNETTSGDPRVDAAADSIVGCTLPGVSFRMGFHDRLAREVLAAADDVDPMRQSNDLSHLYVSRYAFEDVMVECKHLRNAVVLAVQQYAYDVPAEVDRIVARAKKVENV